MESCRVKSAQWRFEVEAMTDPQSLSRVIGYFAQRSIVPTEVAVKVAGEVMHIAIIVTDLSTEHAHIIEGKISQLFVVNDVTLTHM